jgi:hypothetical protein
LQKKLNSSKKNIQKILEEEEPSHQLPNEQKSEKGEKVPLKVNQEQIKNTYINTKGQNKTFRETLRH